MQDRIQNKSSFKELRKKLRNNTTAAEACLWNALKSRQLENRKFRRQQSIENYIVDFYCPAEKLIVELDGNLHMSEGGYENDVVRDNRLAELGFKVLRFENEMVFKSFESVIEAIRGQIIKSDEDFDLEDNRFY